MDTRVVPLVKEDTTKSKQWVNSNADLKQITTIVVLFQHKSHTLNPDWHNKGNISDLYST